MVIMTVRAYHDVFPLAVRVQGRVVVTRDGVCFDIGAEVDVAVW